ncbi:MAG: DUF2064 domain-containing protein [Candidatus Marinimicrobia bacterium]|nr:DUF2064 domain-containing protein [Candidatus Neomarinimicrobiota bacterium]
MQNGTEKCVILFVKCPKPGQVKTRLNPEITKEQSAKLYTEFIRDTLDTLHNLNLPIEIFIDQIPGDGCEALDFLQQELHLQFGNNLGERMKNAFIEVFSASYTQAIIVGSDLPDLPDSVINEAFQALLVKDAVIGPSADGGYYLLGFKQNTLLHSVFYDIPWSTGSVYRDTIRELESRAYDTYELKNMNDVDDIGDLRDFVERNSDEKGRELHSMRYLKESGLLDELKSESA